MRLFDILHESYPQSIPVPGMDDDFTTNNSRTLSAVEHFVRENCRPWLTSSGGSAVYRGTRSAPNHLAFVRDIRTDRKPKDSQPHQNRVFDFWLEAVGARARRVNSAFVTGNLQFARDYGDPYVVMPVGPFHYSWSTVMEDWYRDTADRSDSVFGHVVDLDHIVNQFNKWDPRDQQEFEARVVKETQWSFEAVERDLRGAIQEVISNDQWYALSTKAGDGVYNPNTHSRERVKQVILADERLPEAIQSGHEIMIAAQSLLYILPDLYKNLNLSGRGA